MDYPEEYIDFLVHFHGDRDYFECHELLEDFWKKVDQNNKESIWVGLIQLAVANYHHRRENFTGAERTLHKALEILSIHENKLGALGIHSENLYAQIRNRLVEIKNKQVYESMNIPLLSYELEAICIQRCQQFQMEWQKKSDLSNLELVHRHTRRDRTDVINSRRVALQNKMNKRQ